MDLNQIAVFVRVVDSGSMTRAAATLKQPKSRVSRKVAALERELGVPLLYRNTRQLSLTAQGQALYERCRQQVYELEGASQTIRGVSKEVGGIVRLTATGDMGPSILGPMISELGSLHPNLNVDVLFSNDYVDLVKDGVDLALRVGELEDTTLKSRRVGYVTLILVAGSEYLKSAGTPKRLADVSRHPAIYFDFAPGDAGWSLQGPGKRTERIPIRIRHRSNNPRFLIDLAAGGQGIALVPEYLCVDALASGRLKRLFPGWGTKPLPVHFVWPAQRETHPNVRAVVDFGVKRLAKYFPSAGA